MPQNIHQHFVNSAISRLEGDARFLGLAAGGSWITGELDEFSDLNLLLVTTPNELESVLTERVSIAELFGPLLNQFTSGLPGAANLTIALYDDPLLHVELNFLSLGDLGTRNENPAVLWERDGAVTRVLEETKPTTEHLDLQWVEDRFWTWVHYGAQRLGRGELFEVISTLNLLRTQALGPMESARSQRPPRGVRRLERFGDKYDLQELRTTIPSYEARSCEQALKAAAKMYVGLRETLDKGTLKRNRRTEMAALRYLHEISGKI